MGETTLLNPEVIIIGSGVMSAHLSALLKQLKPEMTIQVYEATDELAQESSNGWNNAGTGHAGICELSYTPHREPDGTVNVRKAIEIFAEFEQSKQFWAYAVAQGMVERPEEFITPLPHISFVHGAEMVDYLRARFEGLQQHHFFTPMEFSTEVATIHQWAPLLTEARGEIPIAATRMAGGTDVNFGNIARKLLLWLETQPGAAVTRHHRVLDLAKHSHGWEVTVKDLHTGAVFQNHAKFVFVGAGGGSLHLLQKSGIPEAKGLGGFPIGGQWLICDNPEIVAKHQAKVYGQPLASAPTMAVPHLDTRILDGKKTLLFGPFAAWTTKFLHRYGSIFDLPKSIRWDNLATLVKIGISNVALVRYLIQQGTQRMKDRMDVLQVFYPGAKAEDWRLIDAGIRVQAIKKTDGEAGIVHYGTEVITNADHSLAALLGASPGASVSVNIVLNVINRCFPELIASEQGRARMQEMVPTWNVDATLPEQAAYFQAITNRVNAILELNRS
jgi:malate dehydrogenase (quinone)